VLVVAGAYNPSYVEIGRIMVQGQTGLAMPTTWWNILGVSERVFLDEINIQLVNWVKKIAHPNVGGF
jgi:hypothetical protein